MIGLFFRKLRITIEITIKKPALAINQRGFWIKR